MKYNRRFVTPNEMHEFQRFGDTALMPDPELIAQRAYRIGLQEGGGGTYYTKDETDALLERRVARADFDPIMDDLPDGYTIEDLKKRQDAILQILRYGHL